MQELANLLQGGLYTVEHYNSNVLQSNMLVDTEVRAIGTTIIFFGVDIDTGRKVTITVNEGEVIDQTTGATEGKFNLTNGFTLVYTKQQ